MSVRTVVVACLISALSEAAFVDTIRKCSVKDEECLRTSFGDNFRSIGGTGIPELEIPKFDPLELENESVSLPDLFDLQMRDVRVTGIKNCNVDKFVIDLDKGEGINELTCDLIIAEGKYQFTASSPMFKDVFGIESIHGDGNGKIELEKLNLKLDFLVSVEKREGELYLKYDYKHISYKYEVLGKAKLFADSIYIGEKESSKEVLKFVNDNWKLVLNTVGKAFFDKTMKIAYSIVSKFYNNVPAKYYLTDLSS